MKLSTFALVGIMSFSCPLFAHEGHGQLPGQLKALHGGLVKAGNEMNLEMLYSNGTAKFFPVAHADETIDVSKVRLTGTIRKPKGKETPLSFTSDGKSFSTKVDLKGTYRADLEIQLHYEGKTDSFKFLVEK